MGVSDDDRAAVDLLQSTLSETIAWHERVRLADPAPILAAASATIRALKAGRQLLLFGNGGSAADAQHVAAELVGRFQRERPALSAIALTADTSILTSIGNDMAYERIFSRQVEALGRKGDVALGISTSGMSPNVVAGLAAARGLGLHTVALTGRDGGDVGRCAEIHINVPAESTARVQEVHRTLLHVICDLVERAMAPHPPATNA
jgi:D-sedoheptulose 7-phosphate isomerase